MKMVRLLAWWVLAAGFGAFLCGAQAAAEGKPNVLLIIADDLNDWVGPLGGHPQAKTPNLDKLAARGLSFRNAQVAAPLCNPSRASMLGGKRPSTTGIYDNQQLAMPHLPRGTCLNDYVRQHGYTSLGAGKIYHYRQYRAEDWSEVVFPTDDTLPKHEAKRRPGPFGYRMFTEGEPDEPFNEQRAESKLVDAQSVSWCIEKLGSAQGPFFMVCGLHRPHTPWDVPKKYFDLYPLESIQLPSVKTNDLADVPTAGRAFAKPNAAHANVLKAGVWKDRVRAYLASISYMDAQMGRLVDALEKSDHRTNTIVVFVSDHGWHLGEKQHWAKSALWRQATRVPYVWVVPGMTKAGTHCDRAVDTMSLYPTICELTGIPVPKHVEGVSIKPLLAKPQRRWSQPAISTFLKGNHAVVTEEWRFIRYADGTEELYNQKSDPNEWTNQAGNAEFAKIKRELAKHLPLVNAEPVAHKEEAPPKKKKTAKKEAEED
jgi:arylsulfatase A-like enzyme